MKSKFNIVEGFVPATPRSQRKKNAVSGGGSTVVVEGSGGEGSVSDPNSHTHTNLPLLESLADQDGYLTRKEENPDTAEDADPFVYTKVKAGFADKAEDSEKWNGKAFADFLDQPVRKADSVEHKSVTVSESVTSKDFIPGDISGSGFGFYRDANGNAVAEVDIVKARKEAIFNEAVINQVTFQVGATVFSNGGCEITRVEDLDDVYRCYYNTKEGRRFCGLVVDDQVRCQRYDATQNTIIKYYWRLVVAVGDDYVDLSKTDVDGTGVPEEGDEIAQFGHRTDKTRQGATIIDPKDGSSVVVYSEINSYSLVKNNFVGLGTNPQTGRPYLFCYGDLFIGDRELKDQFLTYQIKEGQSIPQLFAQMNIMLGAGSSGLTNLTEWAEKQQQIDDAQKAAEDAQEAVDNLEPATRNLALNSGGELSFNSERWDALYLELEEQPDLGAEYTLSWDDLQWEGPENTIIIRLWAGSYIGVVGIIRTTEKGPGSKTITIPESFRPDLTYRLLFGFNSAGNSGFAKNVMWAKGNKRVPWTPAMGDMQAEIDTAQSAADNAAAGIDSLKDFTDTAFADGVVDRAEAAAIEKYTNSVTETKDAVDAAYETVYNNTLLGGTAKSNLQAAKSAFDTAVADLLAEIQTASADGIATAEEKANVDAKYSAFNIAYGAFSTRIEEAQKYVQTAINTTAQGALQLSQELQTAVNNLTESIIPDLQDQIDKQIVSYNGTDVPTLDNYPASDWTDDTERARHVNDYYDRKITDEDGEVSYERYKFAYENSTYQWVRIADSGAAGAQAKALEALGVANGKNKVYFGDSTPAVPYIINDLWIKTSGDIYISNADRAEGATGSAADWQLVNDAQLRLRQMSSDDVISKEEKATLRNTLVQMQKEYASYQSDATTYGVSIAALQTAYTNLTTFLTGTIAVNNDTDTTLTSEQRTTYNTYFANYYAEVSRFTNLVADAIAQGKVDDMQVGGVNLIRHAKSMIGGGWIWGTQHGSVLTSDNVNGWAVGKIQSQWGHFYYTALTLKAGMTYTLSAYVRYDVNTVVSPIQSAYFTLYGYGRYTLLSAAVDDIVVEQNIEVNSARQNCIIATHKNTNGYPVLLTSEWRRMKISIKIGEADINNQEFRFESFTSPYQQDGKNIPVNGYIYGWQIEEGTKATALKEAPEDIQEAIDAAKQAGDEAKAQLATWASDAYISPTEKTALKQQQSDIKAEYAQIVAEAQKYNITQTASGEFEDTPAYWESGSANMTATGSTWEAMKTDSTKSIRTKMLLTANNGAKLSVNSGYLVRALIFITGGLYRTYSSAAQSVTVSDTYVESISLLISKSDGSDITVDDLAAAGLTASDDVVPTQTPTVDPFTAYTSAYTAADAALTKYTAASPSDIPIEADYDNIEAYYTAREKILDAIADAVKKYVDDVEFSSINLIDGSESVTVIKSDTSNVRYSNLVINGVFKSGDKVALSVGDIVNLIGEATEFSVVLAGIDINAIISDTYNLTQDNKTAVLTFNRDTNEPQIYLYAGKRGETAGKSVRYDKVMLVRGNKPCLTWAPSPADVQAEIDKVQQAVSDLDYLKEVFPDAMLDVNGVVLAQLLGVKSSTAADAAVVAGFYGGSDETLNAAGFKDATHGILMMFAGADNVQSAASAKTRVYGDGSLFTQMLYADGGKIGGFTIQGSSLQAGASDADNLYLSSSLLKFSPGDYTGSVYIGSNVMPGVSGMKGLMRLELEGDVGTLMYTKATKVGGLSIDRMRSWTNYGDLFSIGSKVFVSDKFRGTAYSDTIELNFDQTDTFIFSYSANSGTTMAVNLPAISAIESTFGSRYVTFKLTLLCERSFSGTIRITAPSSAPLLNNSGDIINGGNGHIDMGRGDVIVLQYASGYYYFVSRMS